MYVYIYIDTKYLCDDWSIPQNSIYHDKNMQYLTDSTLNVPTSLYFIYFQHLQIYVNRFQHKQFLQHKQYLFVQLLQHKQCYFLQFLAVQISLLITVNIWSIRKNVSVSVTFISEFRQFLKLTEFPKQFWQE